MPKLSQRASAFFGLFLFHHAIFASMPGGQDQQLPIFSSYVTSSSMSSLTTAASLNSLKQLEERQDTYTINFNEISAAAYIRFVSKITNLNFIFNEEDLNFNVTIVSEEPLSTRNIASTLIQILRVHGLNILEQEGNLLITSVQNVSHMATVVTQNESLNHTTSPIVTKVFPIKNANINTVAAIIKPMLSASALLEISPETRQMIITDVITNLDKILTLLTAIDTPQTPYDTGSYQAKYVEIQDLMRITKQLMTPLSESNTFLLIPQADTSTIFVVSTPHLVEKSISILRSIDLPISEEKNIIQRNLSVFLYQLEHRTSVDFLTAIHDLKVKLEKQGASLKLVDALSSARWVQDSNSIVFIADDDTLAKIKTFLPIIDSSLLPTETSLLQPAILIHKIQFVDPQELKVSLSKINQDLQKSSPTDIHLVEALNSNQWLEESNSFLFIGTESALAKITNFLKIFDTSDALDGIKQIFIYHPKHHDGQDLADALTDLLSQLTSHGYSDPVMLEAVQNMQWMPFANGLIFSAPSTTLIRLEKILSSLDHVKSPEPEQEASAFFIYKLKDAKGPAVINSLRNIAKNFGSSTLSNPNLVQVLEDATYISDNNSILITGKASAIEHAKLLIAEFDVPDHSQVVESHKNSFFIYKPVFLSPPLLLNRLKDVSHTLNLSGFINTNLLQTIDQAQYIQSTETLVFTGIRESLQKIEEIIEQLDVTTPTDNLVQKLGTHTFLIYKIQNAPPQQLIISAKDLASQLNQQGAISEEELGIVENLKYIKETNSILFTGPTELLQNVENFVKKLDTAILVEKTPADTSNHFVVYTPQHQSGPELIQMLQEFQNSLSASGIANQELFTAISSLKWVPRTRSLIISGNLESIKAVEDLLVRFDVPAPVQSVATIIEPTPNNSFLIYKLQYHQGGEILNALKQIGVDLPQKGPAANSNLFSAINSLQWIKVTNSLLASGPQKSLVQLEELMKNLDVPLRQVFIEVLVIETDLSNTQNFGLQWGGNLKYLNKFSAATGNFPLSSANSFNSSSYTGTAPSIQTGIQTMPPSPSNIPFVNGFDLGVIGDLIFHKGNSFLSLGSLVNALQTDTDSTVVLNPQIITQDNQTSTIFVGANIPFIGSLVTTDSNILSSSSNIEYRDIGFNLTVTPTIGSNDIVTLDIANDISEVVNQAEIGQTNVSGSSTSQITGITTSHTTMATKVHVPNKHFVVLSGMVRDSKARFKSGIPCLGGLPMIGAFFSENDRVLSKHNIIIFMRPHIVDTYEEYKKITESQEDKYKASACQKALQEDFDLGINMVKTADNEADSDG